MTKLSPEAFLQRDSQRDKVLMQSPAAFDRCRSDKRFCQFAALCFVGWYGCAVPVGFAEAPSHASLQPPLRFDTRLLSREARSIYSAHVGRQWPSRHVEHGFPHPRPIVFEAEPLQQRVVVFDLELDLDRKVSGHLGYWETRSCRVGLLPDKDGNLEPAREKAIELRSLEKGSIIPFCGAISRIERLEIARCTDSTWPKVSLQIDMLSDEDLSPGVFHYGRYHAIRPGDLLTTAYGRLQLTAIREADGGLVADVRCLGHWPAAEGVRDRWLTTEHAATVKVGDQLLVPYKGDRVDAYRIFHIVAPDPEHEIPGWVLFDPLIHPSDPLPEELTAEQLADPCCSEFDPDPAIVTHDFTAPPEARKN